MDTYQVQWSGKLISVDVPLDIHTQQARWAYAQTYASGHPDDAMKAAMCVEYPGISWTISTTSPLPFSAAVCGLGHGDSISAPDMSSHGGPSHSRSQMRKPPVSSSAGHHGVSGNEDRHRHPPRFATSSASSPHDRSREEGRPPASSRRPMHSAMPRTGGWMGSATTTPAETPGALRA